MKSLFSFLAVVAIFSTSLFSVRAAGDKQAQNIFDKLLAAQLAENYDVFIADANAQLKMLLTKTKFDASSKVIKKRLKGGYNESFLGDLNKHGYQIFLYRLRPKEGGDDLLATMGLKDGKVGEIYFQ